MKLIVGLGNPGREYENTRHNTGFAVIDTLLKDLNLELNKNKFKGQFVQTKINGEDVIILKPQTYMNLSGEAVRDIAGYFKINVKDILVVYDDMDLPVGKLRIRKDGSSGGQKGMGNIIDLLGTKEIQRLRVGISKNKLIETKDFVLGKISKEDMEEYNKALIKAKDACIAWVSKDMTYVMNHFNG